MLAAKLRNVLAVILLGILPIAANGQTAVPAGQVEMDALVSCAEHNIPLLDDGISGAEVIAKAVAQSCSSQISAVAINISGASASSVFVEQTRQELMEGRLLLGPILRYRVSKNQGQKPNSELNKKAR